MREAKGKVMRAVLLLIGLAVLAGCSAPLVTSSDWPNKAATPSLEAARQFAYVVSRVEPVAEAECRRRAAHLNCDFLIAVDDTPGVPANAHQFLTDNGRPVLAFTYSLIETVKNADELAFVMGHEAAHHIAGHLQRQQASVQLGAKILAQIVVQDGGSARDVREAQKLGAVLGARRYSKEFELEADALGTIVTKRAGFDAVRGAAFFTRLPDPGNQLLGTHPPNAQRLQTVIRTAAKN